MMIQVLAETWITNLIQLGIAGLLLWTALGTNKAAKAAERSAETTASGVRANLLSSLLQEFWSEEYRQAAKRLGDLRRSYEDKGGVTEQVAARVLSHDANPFDPARRLVKGYFARVFSYYSAGFLSRETVKQHLVSPYSLQLLFQVIEPLERAKNPDYDPRMFNSYRQLTSDAVSPTQDEDSREGP